MLGIPGVFTAPAPGPLWSLPDRRCFVQDMLEVGVTNTQKSDCGASGKEACKPLSKIEARTHFGACASSLGTLGVRGCSWAACAVRVRQGAS